MKIGRNSALVPETLLTITHTTWKAPWAKIAILRKSRFEKVSSRMTHHSSYRSAFLPDLQPIWRRKRDLLGEAGGNDFKGSQELGHRE